MRLLGMILTTMVLSSSAYALPAQSNHHDNNKLLAANAPPGLQKKGMFVTPSFLGTTPPGWDEGLKKGWNKNRDWRWNKKTKLWENKNWHWDTHKNTWVKTRGWKK